MKSYTLHYSLPMLRRVVWAFWWRVVGWKYWVAALLLLTGLTLGVRNGDRSAYIGVVATALGMGILLPAVVFVSHYRSTIGRFKNMGAPVARFEAGEERFRIITSESSAEMPWKTIKEIWRRPEAWLVFFSRAQFMTLPIAEIDEEGREYIVSRAKENGARIS